MSPTGYPKVRIKSLFDYTTQVYCHRFNTIDITWEERDYLRSWTPQQAPYYSVEQKKNCNKNLDYTVIKASVFFNLYKLHY